MFWAAALWLASAVLIVAPVQAAELTVLSGNGAKAAVTELAARFERATGHTVSIHFEVNPAVRKRIEGGEAFDVAVLNPPVLDALIAQGKVAGSTRAVFGRSGIGMAVRAGVASNAREPDAARAQVQYLAAPAHVPVLGAFGVEP